jgi:CarD family transcriptional regulator
MKKSTASASPVLPVDQIAEAGKPKRATKTALAPEVTSNVIKTKEVKSLTEINAHVAPDATPTTMPAAPAPVSATVKPAAKQAAKSSAAKAAPKIAAVADDAAPASAAPTMADLVREAARAHRAEEAAGGGKPKAAPKPAPKPAVVAKPAAPPVSATAPIEATPGEAKPVSKVVEQRMGGPIQHNGRPPQISRASNKDESFAEGDYVVYPTHGVGKVEKIAVEDIAGHRLELIHITFEENRMTLRVPVSKARSAGLRKLATRKLFDEALAILKGRARIKRTMWSRRAQEYEAKINSGDPLAIAEVVRDLHRNSGQPDQSFSERQIYEAALDRLAAELGALDQTDKLTAIVKLTQFLKSL